MKRVSLIAAALAASLLGAPAIAQDVQTEDKTRTANSVNSDRATAATATRIIRVSELIGLNIQNSQDQAVGEINDLVIDVRDGSIRYAAVSYGGFLGIGDELHAVPFDRFTLRTDPDDRDELLAMLDVTKEQLEGAKGFNESTWPNFADSSFTKQVESRYPVRKARDDKNWQQKKNALESDRNPTRAGSLDPKTLGTYIRASQLIGMNIQNDAEKGVGEIHDLVLNVADGRVHYVAVAYGGFLGLGDELHAVPMKAFQFKQDPDDRDETVLVLNVTKERMEGAKGFNQDNWPNFADASFTREIDQRYSMSKTYTRSDRDRKQDDDDDRRDNRDDDDDR